MYLLNRSEIYKVGGINIGIDGPTTIALFDGDTDLPMPMPMSITLPVGPVDHQSALDWLVSEDGPFTGGTYISDEARALVRAKRAAFATVKAKRDEAEEAGVTTLHGTFDSDSRSQAKVNGGVTMALIAASQSQPFAMTWRLADNSTVELDGTAMIEVGMAFGQHVAGCQANKNALDAAIVSAETLEDLEAIDLDAGWTD